MTAKNSIVIILMMCVAIGTENSDQVQNFLNGCITSPQLGEFDQAMPKSSLFSGNRGGNGTVTDEMTNNCTTLTLTKIKDVPFPTFQPPAFKAD